MRVKRTSIARELLLRRKLLKGLGALAISAPALSAFGCSSGNTKGGGDVGGSGSGGASVTGPGMLGSGGESPSAGSGGTSIGAGTVPGGTGGTSATSGSGGTSGAAGASNTPAPDAGGMMMSAADAGNDAGAGNDTPPMFDDAGSCTLTVTDIEGPFFIDEAEVMNDESMIRRDVREGMSGCEYRMYFRLLDAQKACAPIANAELYIWHCNAEGYYSGFDGQDPTMPYMGSPNPAPMNLDRFCRGVQVTDKDGVASFVTVYPGWYAGRPIHVHLVARMQGQTTRYITTQLYYPAAFTTEVHNAEPAYMARAASIPAGSLNPPPGSPAMMTLKHTAGLVVGTLNVIVRGS